MDKISIDGLEVFANHGVLAAEKALGQKFLVSVDMSLDLREAGLSDDLRQTVSYAEICNEITDILKNETYDLIEACAEKIASHVLHAHARVCEVSVMIEKPWAPIRKSVRNVSVQITRKRAKIYLGLGSNIGDRTAALTAAIEKMATGDLAVTKCSTFYNTKPVSDIPQNDYLNCVVEAETTLPPSELIARLLQIEAALGRERGERFGPRVIDIDILTYEHLVFEREDVILPHPRMHERLFVLVPFCELNPYYVHPLLNERVIDLKTRLEKTQSL